MSIYRSIFEPDPPVLNYSEDQPRDDDGKWTDGGGGGDWKNDGDRWLAKASFDSFRRYPNSFSAAMREEGTGLPLMKEITEKIRVVRRVVSSMPPVPKGAVVYRGVPSGPLQGVIDGIKSNGRVIVADRAFMFASTKEDRASSFGEVVLKLVDKTGLGRLLPNNEGFPEGDVLYPPGTRIRFTDVERFRGPLWKDRLYLKGEIE